MTDRTAPARDWDALFGPERTERVPEADTPASPPTMPLEVLFLGEPTIDAAATVALPQPTAPRAGGSRAKAEVHPTLLPAVRRRRILRISAISVGALALVIGGVVLFQVMQSQAAAAEAAETASFDRREDALTQATTAYDSATSTLAADHAALGESGLAAVDLANRASAAMDQLPELIQPALADAVRAAADALTTEVGTASVVTLPEAWTPPAVDEGDVAAADEALVLVQEHTALVEEAATAVSEAQTRLTTAQGALLASLDAVYGTLGAVATSAHENNPMPEQSFHDALDAAVGAPAAARAGGGDGIAELLAVPAALTALLDEQGRLAGIAAAEEAARRDAERRAANNSYNTGGGTTDTGTTDGGTTTEPTTEPTTPPATTSPVPPANPDDQGTGGEPETPWWLAD
ncbi:hypothetical protein [Microbacterium stercoris]|uniref:Uncharacterized protein n=1 Tax=Microbacterium stercoris TaxID=2820289 RepID=A0A939QIK3_9MICO|nr:hypothetical protein [Microbacterium stercoris]MBO3663513.1 hypothetical protein [Microbacterium stercoris]